MLPLKITTAGGITLSPEIDEQIKEKVEGLARHFDRITSCRVVVEGPGHHHKKGGEYTVRIDLSVPGDELVVDRQGSEDLAIAVRESFAAAMRRLEDYVHRMRH